MNQNESNQEILIRYLLGDLPEDEKQRLEEKYFVDDDLYDEIRAAERELIDLYVQGELSQREKERFDNHFLSSPGRKRRLRFALTLQKYNSASAGIAEAESPPVISQSIWQKPLFRSQYFRIAAFILIAIGLAFGIWRGLFYESEASKGLAALKNAYRNGRPLEARLSGFDYATLPDARGGQDFIDKKYQNLAERILLDAITTKPNAETHHALGLLYLAQKRFDEAVNELEAALKADPSNASFHSDLGAALLERGKAPLSNEESGRALEDFGKALEHLNEALDLNRELLEPLFNRALCYESMALPNPAKADWQQYLDKDPNSKWADEARRRLKDIEDKQGSFERQKDALQSFLLAYQYGRDEEAWEALSRSQSGNGNSIIERLLDGYLSRAGTKSDHEAEVSLQALSYAGRLASRNTGDHFIIDLSRLYTSVSPAGESAISQARGLMASAHRQYDRARYDEAIGLYSKAREIFERVGDDGESAFAEYRKGHCYLRGASIALSLKSLLHLARYCEERNYTWLLARTLNSIADAYHSQNRFSEALKYSRRSLELSEKVEDTNGLIRNSLQMANHYADLANHGESLRFLRRGLDLSRNLPTDGDHLRLLYDIAAYCFASTGLCIAAVAYKREALALAVKAERPLIQSRCYANLAEIFGRMGNYDEAIKNAQLSFEIGKIHSDQTAAQDMMAFASLILGELYRKSGDYQKAIICYDRNIEIYHALKIPADAFAAHKGKLLCYIAQNDDASAEGELRIALGLVEEYRLNISEESNRLAFFDERQRIYDIATRFQYERIKDPSKAFEYSEASRARSLLDLMVKGVQVTEGEYKPDLDLPGIANPLTLSEIQARMPEETQILQYAALDDITVIWVISKTGFSSAVTKVPLDDLKAKVQDYWQRLAQPSDDQEEAQRLAKELYELLIGPVESLLDRKKYICIVPDGILNYVSFNSLISPTSHRYMIEDYSMGLAPSSTIFVQCSDTARSKGEQRVERVLSVGNPRFDRTEFPSLQDLPDAYAEAAAAAGLYKAAHFLSLDAAKEEQVKNEFAQSDVVHLAAHYVADERTPMLSKLLLAKEASQSARGPESDGILQSWEIYGLNLPRTRLVVLSACQTGIERSYRGEGAIGMARPFIAAEVPLVVASLWPVDSQATARLMIDFHKRRKIEALPTAEALRKAQLYMIGGPEARFRQPHYWASFVVTGGYATF